MEVLIFQKEAFEEMTTKFSRFSDRVNELLAKQGSKSLNRWMDDNQEVCRQLNISPRTLQTLRDNGTLAYSQINHKVFYRPEDVSRIVKPVERKLADKAV
ncbi:helix-turn-helix domain-containing protein [Phocaeicola barnesiae]|uniref:helix-turn-helix domain-containing protein n=1 Tax=Phocaeicola barnesiae TaxID=376804 RepID=UPI0025A4A289|nr:helix-turn-helix domain-containing protein [Phocaeicola barnesiae]MDM8255547.1 helix-turn-helix domain-containing protein [Phocaeicola barnesiae]